MKRFIASLSVLGTITTAFVPAYIVDKYTLRNANGTFVNSFRPAVDSEANRIAANAAQAKFAASQGK